MSQYGNMDLGFPGMVTDGTAVEVDTRLAVEEIAFGAPVFVAKGLDDLGYAVSPAAADAVARIVDVTPTIGTAASGTVTLSIGAKTFTATTTSGSTVATVIDSLVAAVNADATAGFTAVDGTTKLTLTAAVAGVNTTTIAVTPGTSGFTFVVAQTTAGSAAIVAYELFGVARATQKELGKYSVTDAVNVLRSGPILVLVGKAVQSGTLAYWDATNKYWTDSASGTTASSWKFRSTTTAAGIASLEAKIN